MTTPNTADLARYGAGYIHRWTAWLADHPDADPALVAALMGKGEPPPEEVRQGGRPSKLTPEVQEIIVTAVRHGLYYEDAANMAGVTYDSLNNWRKRGEAENERRANDRVKENTALWEREEPYFQFFNAIKRAEGAALFGWMQKIEKAADEQWQAAAWKAERRYPERYGRQRLEHTTPDGQPLVNQTVNFANVSDDELYDAIARAMGQLATPPAGEAGSDGR